MKIFASVYEILLKLEVNVKRYYRPQRSWAKVIFLHVSVILLTVGGGGVWSEIWGGGVWSEILGGGCLVWNFRGGVCVFWSEIFEGGSEIFISFFFQFLFPPQKILLGYTHTLPPLPPRDGQCAAGTHPTGMHSCYSSTYPESNAICFSVHYGTLHSNRFKECECIVEFPLIHFNVFIRLF